MSDRAYLWSCTIATIICVFVIFYGYVHFINKFNLCLVESVKIHVEYGVPLNRVSDLCR